MRLRRTREECEAARLKFHRIEYGIRNAQQIWRQQEDRLEIDAMTDLRKELDNLEIDCLAAAPELFKRAELELQTKCQVRALSDHLRNSMLTHIHSTNIPCVIFTRTGVVY